MKKAAEILKELKCPFIINQNAYNIFDRTIENNGLKTASKEIGKGIIAFSPLSQGLLTDRYLKGIPNDSRVKTSGVFLKEDRVKEMLPKIKKLNELALSRGQSLAQMSLQWILKDDYVTSVLIGASKPEQVLDNLKILSAPPFSADELKLIDEYSL